MEYYLSDDELIVLASLMGEGIVYGINTSLFEQWNVDSEARIKEIMDDLDNRELIDIDFMGIVHMKEDLYDLIACVVLPDAILHVQDACQDIYYYKNRQNIFQMTKSNTYHHFKSEIEPYYLNGEEIKEEYTISKDVLQKIEECYDCFDFEGALQLLDGKQWLEDIVDSRDQGIYLTYLEWQDRDLIEKEQCRFGFKNNEIYEVVQSIDESILIKRGKAKALSVLNKMFERRIL